MPKFSQYFVISNDRESLAIFLFIIPKQHDHFQLLLQLHFLVEPPVLRNNKEMVNNMVLDFFPMIGIVRRANIYIIYLFTKV